MSDYYQDLPELLMRIGQTADRPTNPPDKNAGFWNIETGKIYAVNDSMEWVLINPDPPPYTGESHIRVKPVSTSINPNAVMWVVPPLGALISEVRFVVTEAYDLGIVLSIGDDGDNERLMSATFSDPPLAPQTIGTYFSYPIYQYPAASAIKIYCTGGTPTTGAGTLYIWYDENPTEL